MLFLPLVPLPTFNRACSVFLQLCPVPRNSSRIQMPAILQNEVDSRTDRGRPQCDRRAACRVLQPGKAIDWLRFSTLG